MYTFLNGVRVLDLTSVVLGPFVTQILGDLGADIVKVESPHGDIFRGIAPARSAGMGSGFLNLNKNKRSIVLDLKSQLGKDALYKLIETSDIFVHNMRLSAINSLGLAYKDIMQIKESIIYCSAVGFGSKGPYANQPAYDDIIQAVSGFAYLSRSEKGVPSFIPTVLADKIGGFYALYGILAALYARAKTGKGVEIEAPMFESLASFILAEHMQGKIFNPAMGESGYKRLTNYYRRPHKTADGYLGVLPYSTKNWQRFLNFVHNDDLANADWVADSDSRSKKIEILYRVLSEELVKHPSAFWIEKLQELDIPCSPVNSLDDLFDDPHLNAVSFFKNCEHPTEGQLLMTRHPVSFSGDEREDKPAPNLGQHGYEILIEAGFSDEHIKTMEENGAVQIYRN